ncbi:(2Fe-2S)-binding protein [Sphingosinicellaceae bacterium]|nr:(2Fe-2S)-binding protein [Sphingosinicellaceae bacterium]
MTEPSVFDLAIVGGGPAGQAAAEIAIANGLSVVMFDEQQRLGGQILRQPPVGFAVARWMQGRAYRGVAAQLARATALTAIDWRGGTSVLGLFKRADGFDIVANGPAGPASAVATRVLIAAGCYDMPVALPGWTTPGVMGAGAVQAFIKSQQFLPGRRFVLAGTHPLQLLVADQVRRGGGTVVAVIFAQSAAAAVARVLADPLTAVLNASTLASAAVSFARLRWAGVSVRFGTTVARAEGRARLSSVTLQNCVASGPTGRTAGVLNCDTLALCFGFLPQADLPRATGCTVERDPATGGWATTHDAWLRSSIVGLFVAGETTGVAGADCALEEGRIAGLGIALDAGRLTVAQADAAARAPRARLARRRKFAAMLADIASPAAIVPQLIDDTTIVCRCEDVTRGQLRAAMASRGGPGGASSLKLVTRAGMGLCQGRSCEQAVMTILGETGRPAGFTARFPVRPVAVADLI